MGCIASKLLKSLNIKIIIKMFMTFISLRSDFVFNENALHAYPLESHISSNETIICRFNVSDANIQEKLIEF